MIAPLKTDNKAERGKCGNCGGTAPPDSLICDFCGMAAQLEQTTEALNEALVARDVEAAILQEYKTLLELLANAYRGVVFPNSSTVDPWPMIDKLLGNG